eukprot:1014461-Amphidinium_carterae.1
MAAAPAVSMTSRQRKQVYMHSDLNASHPSTPQCSGIQGAQFCAVKGYVTFFAIQFAHCVFPSAQHRHKSVG